MREVARDEHDRGGWICCEKCFKRVFIAKKQYITREPFVAGEPCDFCGGVEELTKEQHAFLQLVNYVPEFVPSCVPKEDRDAPLFSEAMLYPLLGKEEARSVRARLRRLARILEAGEVWHGYKRKKRAKAPRTRGGTS